MDEIETAAPPHMDELETLQAKTTLTPAPPHMDELETLQAKTALRLTRVIPFLFPEHLLLKHLKNELRLAKEDIFMRGWHDNCPVKLREEFIVFNSVTKECNCEICQPLTRHYNMVVNKGQECRLWQRITWYMSQAGVTMLFGIDERKERLFMMRAKHTGRMSDMYPVTIEPEDRPVGFNEMTACKYLAPVSYFDVHVVFRRRNNAYEFVYGRKLWDQRTFDNPELRKLDLFRARLHSAWSVLGTY